MSLKTMLQNLFGVNKTQNVRHAATVAHTHQTKQPVQMTGVYHQPQASAYTEQNQTPIVSEAILASYDSVPEKYIPNEGQKLLTVTDADYQAMAHLDKFDEKAYAEV